jgi:iron complex outermembrane recepter protein
MRASVVMYLLAALVGGWLLVVAGPAHSQVRYEFDQPSQPLGAAIRAIGDKAGVNVLFDPTLTAGKTAQPLRGTFTAEEALNRLGSDAGLIAVRVQDGTISMRKKSPDNSQSDSNPQAERRSETTGVYKAEGIVVTARKRSELIQDVPVPVSAITAETLADNSQLRLQDYYTKVPGLNLMTISDGSPIIAIRGIVAGGQTASTVGIVIDDVPYGGSINPGSPARPPDIDPGDLARIEVLRGPQGTLYGATSIGGLIKYVTVDPSTDRFSGRVQAGFSKTNYGDFGHTFRGAVNVPLSETLAIRASGFTTRDPGYVDNTLSGAKDINGRDNYGGRASALWRPSDSLSIKLSASIQDSTRDGNADVDTALGTGLLQRGLPGTGVYERASQNYSLNVDWRLGNVDLTSVTGYSFDKVSTKGDLSAALGTLSSANFPGASGVTTPYFQRVDKVSQELRASLRLGSRVTWLIGGFYADEDYDTHFEFAAANPTTGETVGNLLVGNDSPTYKEYAAFSTLTFDVTNNFDVQVGGRVSQNKQTFSSVRSGPLQGIFYPGAAVVPIFRSKDTALTYLVTPRYKFSPDFMAYARAASGYRPGGPNVNCGPTFPCQYDADRSENYEIGVKGNLGNAVTFDASLYYIDWKNVQISLRDPVTTVVYAANAARAESKGAELALELRPLRDLTLTVSGAYSDAVLSRDFPPTTFNASGRKGDRLPYSSKLSGSLAVDQEFRLGQKAIGYVGASASYVGSRRGRFVAATAMRQLYPSYSQVDLRAGVRYETWYLNAYLNNVTDERGILNGGVDAVRPTFFTYIQPRTLGLNLTKSF